MILLQCDYHEGATPAVLDALQNANARQSYGYGMDSATDEARALIRSLCHAPDADVHFFVGGTQANMTIIAAALRPHEGVLSSDLGHINVHESGAIEATGHKVLALPNHNGKISADQIRKAYEDHVNDVTHEHMVRPAMIYLSHPTELGTLYSREELSAIRQVADECGLKLYIDGARLAYGIAADGSVDLPYLASICDAFTIGGTKCGLLFGEAAVLKNAEDWPFFRYHIKQRGGLLAKGWLLAVQFTALLSENRYLALAKHANHQAQTLKQAFLRKGYHLLSDTQTNQIFPILPNTTLKSLENEFFFAFWEAVSDTDSSIRISTSVTTPDANVTALLSVIEAL